MVKYSLTSIDGEEFLLVLTPDGPQTATVASHTNFEELVSACRAGDESVYELLEVGRAIEKKFADLDDVVNGRIAVRGGQVYYDDDVLDNVVAEKILQFFNAQEDFTPLAHYVENIMANPNAHSREQFYRWLEHNQFPISDDGCIVGYKSVRKTEGGYESHSAGHAFVNGSEVHGHVPQNVGDVVTMPRSEVAHDPNVACHTGLHVGTWEYASTFGSNRVIMLVKINPRDVVSVPHDCTSQKVRVCRYEVIGFAETKSEALRYVDAVATGDADVAEAEAKADPDDVYVAPAKVDGVFANGDKVKVKLGRFGNRLLAFNVDKYLSHIVGRRGTVREPIDNTPPAHHVYIGGVKYALWADELEHDTTDAVRDTRLNHKSQKRDASGRFVKS